MALRIQIDTKTLAALGAPRLAELLIEISAGDAALKRRLRLELAGPQAAAKEIRKRLATIARSRSYVEWEQHKALVKDLEAQRQGIVTQVGATDPAEALELMWRFLDLADGVHRRADDSNGDVSAVFTAACRDLGPLAAAARAEPIALADRVYAALQGTSYGQHDELIETLAPALGGVGLEHLKARFIELSKIPVERPPQAQRRAVAWGSGGAYYADEMEASHRASTIRLALRDIADAQGDVEAFIAQYDAKARKAPTIAAEIARRYLAAGRAEDALRALDQATPQRIGWTDFVWEDARIDTLDALARGAEAQAVRWACFEQTLSAPHLRDYLKRLPDFDDVEVEQRALEYALAYSDRTAALYFLVSWPALDRAAKLVLGWGKEIDGNRYDILTPAAQALGGKYPLAATLALRAMIGFTLVHARASRYRHAARHLQECASLAGAITFFGAHEGHDAYVAKLRAAHGRKSGFWSLMV